MRRLILLSFLLAFLSNSSIAQDISTAKHTGMGKGNEITIFGRIVAIDTSDSLDAFKCTLSIGDSGEKIIIIVPQGTLSRSSISSLVIGQLINVGGLFKSNGELYIEVRNISLIKNMAISKGRVTSVVLSPPPGARYWGEQVKEVDIDEISKHVGDTVKVLDKIFGYKLLENMTMLYLGAAYPNQKLTVILTDDAREYLAAQINLQGRGDASKYLQEKKFRVIGVVIQNEGKPEISTKDPNGFIVEDK